MTLYPTYILFSFELKCKTNSSRNWFTQCFHCIMNCFRKGIKSNYLSPVKITLLFMIFSIHIKTLEFRKHIFSTLHLIIKKYEHRSPKNPINYIHNSQFRDYRDSYLQRGINYWQQQWKSNEGKIVLTYSRSIT